MTCRIGLCVDPEAMAYDFYGWHMAVYGWLASFAEKGWLALAKKLNTATCVHSVDKLTNTLYGVAV